MSELDPSWSRCARIMDIGNSNTRLIKLMIVDILKKYGNDRVRLESVSSIDLLEISKGNIGTTKKNNNFCIFCLLRKLITDSESLGCVYRDGIHGTNSYCKYWSHISCLQILVEHCSKRS